MISTQYTVVSKYVRPRRPRLAGKATGVAYTSSLIGDLYACNLRAGVTALVAIAFELGITVAVVTSLLGLAARRG